MAFYANSVIAEIERQVRVFYFARDQVRGWNLHRRGEELRLVTGWTWATRDGRLSRTGFKTRSAALRDAYYVVLQGREQPADVRRPRPVVAQAAAAPATPAVRRRSKVVTAG